MFSKQEIKEQFPIKSQTSSEDKKVILKIISLFKNYSYCEIGSFLGGSLTPHLKTDTCYNILSIDDRERVQPDERGILYNYAGITSQTMIDNLKELNLDLQKLKVFDRSIQHLPEFKKTFDLIFIDGEHTDNACFRDFLYSMKLINNNGIILFHDSTIVYKGIQMCLIYLEANAISYKFIKVANSEMTIIFLENRSTELFDEENPAEFFLNAEKYRIMQLIKNRSIIDSNISDAKIENII
jgi:Methyltransferase domain